MSIINYNRIDIIGNYKYHNIIHIEGRRTSFLAVVIKFKTSGAPRVSPS